MGADTGTGPCDREGCESFDFEHGWLKYVGTATYDGVTLPRVEVYCSQECLAAAGA